MGNVKFYLHVGVGIKQGNRQWVISAEGDQSTPPLNIHFWHEDYFGAEANEK